MEENGFGSNASNLETTTTADDTAIDLSLQKKHTTMLECLSNCHHSWLAGKSIINFTTLNAPPSFESTKYFLSKFSQTKVYVESCLSQIHQQQENQNPSSDSIPKIDIQKISLSISDLEKLVAENSYFLPSYEVQAFLKNIENLKHSLDDVTSLVIPNKTLSLKNEPSKKPTNPVQNDVIVEKSQNARISEVGI
ncbi:Tubulin-folding cofactor C [Forsythia ovata]|uniref:Tubulin-folding cofactor C n=1 Tax=Forsythia ovata TaxID=205694 RepID=A0ABD1QB41_9LAMI